MLGAKPLPGRTLMPSDDTPGNEKVVVLSHGLWHRRFGAACGHPFEVVGQRLGRLREFLKGSSGRRGEVT